jgi:hypothetical protein
MAGSWPSVIRPMGRFHDHRGRVVSWPGTTREAGTAGSCQILARSSARRRQWTGGHAGSNSYRSRSGAATPGPRGRQVPVEDQQVVAGGADRLGQASGLGCGRLEQHHPGDRENSMYASVALSLHRLPARIRGCPSCSRCWTWPPSPPALRAGRAAPHPDRRPGTALGAAQGVYPRRRHPHPHRGRGPVGRLVLAAADGNDDGAIHGDDVNRAFRAAFVGMVAR